MATVGKELITPEDGWLRIDDNNPLIVYVGSWSRRADGEIYNSYNYTWIESYTNGDYIEFYAKTTRFRMISYSGGSSRDVSGFNLEIDGVMYNTYTCVYALTKCVLCCDISGLTNEVHKFRIVIKDKSSISGSSTTRVLFDCIDIDSNGYITNDYIPSDGVYKFDYTGNVQQFIIPSTGLYKLECWGASGGNGGGKGGYSHGEIKLTQGEKLSVYVGGAGTEGASIQPGGFNGGSSTGTSYYDGNNGSGGGATDIRFKGESFTDRIIVAGGGGGIVTPRILLGHGGGLNGCSANGGTGTPSTGGTQTNGGAGNVNGTFGLGAYMNGARAGAGGGWYGGGVAAYSGGGGSGYIGTLKNAITVSGGEQMPSIISDTTMIGNIGNGFAKITFLKPLKNMQHFYIECDNKKYIPTKQFWNDNLNGFIPVEDYVLKDLENDSREFMLDVTNLLKPFEINGRLIIPIDSFKNKKFKVYKFIGFNKNWALTGADNINGLNNNINLSYKIKNSILGKSFIKLIEYIRDFDFKKYDYKLKSDCPNIKIGLFHNGEYYGKDFKVILKDDIINNGFDINKLNDIEIPFKDFKIIAVMTGNEYLNQIKLYKKLRPVSKLIDKKRYKIYYDNIQKRIYIIFDSGKIRNLTVNKLGKHEETFGIINSLEDIKGRI